MSNNSSKSHIPNKKIKARIFIILTSVLFLLIFSNFSTVFSRTFGIQSNDTKTNEIRDVSNLSFQADIYGGTGLETVEYISDIAFHSYGGFGTNAHVVRSNLATGDEIAYAVSTNDPNSFTLQVSPVGETTPTDTLTITKSQYPTGEVEMVSTNELHFSWEIIQSGYQIILHKNATLVANPNLTSGYMFLESFSIENFGENFDLHQFTEYLHMDDISRLRDYDYDGKNETLLAINDFSTSGYPVFGKINLRRQSIDVGFVDDGRYAHITYEPFYRLMLTGETLEVSNSAYVTSLAKNGTNAEFEVSNDAYLLLSNRPCELAYFSQLDESWKNDPIPCDYPFNTIGRGGCAITSSAMVVSSYGEFTTPNTLNTCLGRSACPLSWDKVWKDCSDGNLYGKSYLDVSDKEKADVLKVIDVALNIDKIPVILGLQKYNIVTQQNQTHFVLVVSGSGTDPNNYRIHDPAYLCGANINLGEIYDAWDFNWRIIYFPRINCENIKVLTPACNSDLATAVPVNLIRGTSEELPTTTYNETLNRDSIITGDINIFTLFEGNVFVSLNAESSLGNITEIRVWSDSYQISLWQDFSPLVYLPKSEFVYAQFKDEFGNISDIYSTTIYPSDPPTLINEFFLPIICK